MGLSGRKEKQRLVGSAVTRNAAWLNDASLPGQRMLAQMGWKEGQGLGTTMTGMAQNLTVSLKLDNKGIGAARYEREARAAGKDAWVGGGGDLGSLFDRLNAANSAAASPAPTTTVTASSSSDEGKDKKSSRKKESKSRDGETKEERKQRKRAEKEAKKQEKKDKKRKRSKSAAEADEGGEEEDEKRRRKKAKKDKKRLAEEAVAEAVAADPALGTDKKTLKQVKQDVQAGKPIRLAHRAKFLRAKRMVGNDLASVNEILGIKSATASPGASGQSTPLKTYPGPGGAQIALADVDGKLAAAGTSATSSSSSSSSPSESGSDKSDDEAAKKASKKAKRGSEGKEKRERSSSSKKGKRKADPADADSSSESESDDEAAKRSGKKAKKAERGSKNDKKDKKRDTPSSLPAPPPVAAPPAEQTPTDESRVQIGTNAQGLSVHEYLSRRLMLRKAQIARRKKEENDAIYSRAATISA